MNTDPVYIAYAHCGCIFAACVDGADHVEDTGREIGKWRRDKQTKEVRRLMPDEFAKVRELPHFFNHHPHGYKDPAKCPLRQDPTPDMFTTLAE